MEENVAIFGDFDVSSARNKPEMEIKLICQIRSHHCYHYGLQ